VVGPGWGLALGLYEAGHLADERASVFARDLTGIAALTWRTQAGGGFSPWAWNAKSAAPTEGAALEMPGLTGGQMVGLEEMCP